MEVFGIFLSIPGAFISAALYRILVVKARSRWREVGLPLMIASSAVLVTVAAEWLLLVSLGAVRAGALIGPTFCPAHLVNFFLGVPALVNVLVLPNPAGRYARWSLVVPLCTAFAVVLVVQQYTVTEALYGIDGIGSD